jgi:hypothetical protein
MSTPIIRAKFRVHEVTRRAYAPLAEQVTLMPVLSTSPDDPNHSWSQATPMGELKLTITNPEAHGKLELGNDYFLDFTPAT